MNKVFIFVVGMMLISGLGTVQAQPPRCCDYGTVLDTTSNGFILELKIGCQPNWQDEIVICRFWAPSTNWQYDNEEFWDEVASAFYTTDTCNLDNQALWDFCHGCDNAMQDTIWSPSCWINGGSKQFDWCSDTTEACPNKISGECGGCSDTLIQVGNDLVTKFKCDKDIWSLQIGVDANPLPNCEFPENCSASEACCPGVTIP